METRQDTETLRLWQRLTNMPDTRLNKRLFNWTVKLAENGKKNINGKYNQELSVNMFSFKKIAKNYDKNKWENEVDAITRDNKLRTYKTFKSRFGVEAYVKINLPREQRREYARLRCGVLPIHIETGRFQRPKTPVNERLCTLCDLHQVEDEKHFLLGCPVYAPLRQTMLQTANNVIPDFRQTNQHDQFTRLCKNPHVSFIVAKSTFLMYKLRKSLIPDRLS